MLRLSSRQLVNRLIPVFTTQLRLEFVSWTINPNNERILSRLVAVQDERLIKIILILSDSAENGKILNYKDFCKFPCLEEAEIIFWQLNNEDFEAIAQSQLLSHK